MPLTKKGATIMRAMKSQYGKEQGERVFYASANAGRISGVHKAKKKRPLADADPDGRVWTREITLGDNDAILDAVTKHRDGYVTCEARVARTGLQRYRGYEVGMPTQDHVILYRPPEEVFARDAMRSLANKPITLTHPKTMVDAKTWSKVAKGFSGNEVVRDGEFVRVPLMLTDAAAIEAFETGKARELSVGYLCDIDWTPGATADGATYHGVQRAIRANHHALVPVARGGDTLRFGDAADESQGAGLSECPNCGAELTGNPLTCPQCGYDIHPTPHSGQPFGDYDANQPRDETGKWSSGGGGSANTETPEQKKKRQNPSGSAIRPEEYDDNELNWPDPDTRFGEHPEHPDSRVAFYQERRGPPKNVKIPKGSPFASDGVDAMDPYWMNDREFTEESRKKGAEEGWAKPDGSYPIRNTGDLKNAITAWGRGGATASDKAWIKKRAKALGATSMLPENWQTDADPEGGANQEIKAMPIVRTFDNIPISFADELSAATMEREFRKLFDQVENFKGKKAKPFGKNGNGNGDDEDDDADSIEAKRKKVTAEDGLRKDLLAKDGEIAVLKKQIADAQTVDAKVEAMAAERIMTLDAAKLLLPQGFSPDGKSLSDIRRAAVGVTFGDAEIKDWDDAQIIGAFKTLTKVGAAKTGGGGAKAMADGLSKGMRDSAGYVANGRVLNDAEKDAAAAYNEYVKRISNGYKTPIGDARN